MSGEVQALLMVGNAGGEPPISVCTPDEYYSCGPADPRTVLSIHADTDVADPVINFPLTSAPVDAIAPSATITYNDAGAVSFGVGGATFVVDGTNNSIQVAQAKVRHDTYYGTLVASMTVSDLVGGSGTGDAIRFFIMGGGIRQYGFAFRMISGVKTLLLYADDNSSQITTYGPMPASAKYAIKFVGISTVQWFIDDGLVRTYNGTAAMGAASMYFGPVNGDAAGVTLMACKDLLITQLRTEDYSCYQTKTLTLTGSASISAAQSQFGGKSILVPNAGTSTLNGLVVTDHQDFDFGTGDLTIDLWAYRIANTYVGTLFYGTLGGGEFSVAVGTDGLIDLIYRSSGGSQSFTDVATWPVGQWVYFVTQRRGTYWETYLNGVLIHSAAITGGAGSTVNSTSDLYFGRTNASSAQSWNGYLDDIRVTRGAARYGDYLAPELPTSAFPMDSSGDLHWDKVRLLLKGEGASIVDSSQDARAVSVLLGSPVTSTEQARFGSRSIRMATGDTQVQLRIDIGAAAANKAWTYEGWAYITNRQNFVGFLSDDGATNAIMLRTPLNLGTHEISIFYGGVATFWALDPDPFPLNVWTHFAFSVTPGGGRVFLFINGVKKAESPGTIDGRDVWQPSGLTRIGRTDSAGFSGFPGYLDECRLTIGKARYVADFTPPLITFCESTDPVIVNPLPGTEPLQRVSATCVLGTIKVAGSSTSLTSVSATGAVGSIVPIAAGAPFPDLKENITDNFGTLQLDAPITVWHEFRTDGTIYRIIFDATSTVSTTQVGTWIDNTNPNYAIPTIVDRYTFFASAIKGSTGTFNTANNPSATVILRTISGLGAVASSTFEVTIQVLPTASNPRFGESGYFTSFKSNFILSQPAPVTVPAYPDLISTAYGPQTYQASVPASAYIDFMEDGRVLFFSLAANEIPDFEGRWIQTSTYYSIPNIFSTYSFSSTHWNVLTPGGGVWRRVRIDYGLNTTFTQTIVPNSTNPRFNEAGYIGTHAFTLQLVGLI